MPMEWVLALIGGLLIGTAATVLMIYCGQVAGISGIVFRAFDRFSLINWQRFFIVGLVLGGFVGSLFIEDAFTNNAERSYVVTIFAGLLVGFGTRLGNGCTSGHGVCGISRLSLRGLAATLTFIFSGIVTVTLYRVWFL